MQDERVQASTGVNQTHRELTLGHDDIKYFVDLLKPALELAMQGDLALNYISASLKNLIFLDCDEVLSMYMLKNFPKLSELVNVRFMVLLKDVIAGVLV